MYDKERNISRRRAAKEKERSRWNGNVASRWHEVENERMSRERVEAMFREIRENSKP